MEYAELEKLDELLETYTLERCDMHLANHDNCAGCQLFLGDGDKYEAYCAADKVRAAIIWQLTERRFNGVQ